MYWAWWRWKPKGHTAYMHVPALVLERSEKRAQIAALAATGEWVPLRVPLSKLIDWQKVKCPPCFQKYGAGTEG